MQERYFPLVMFMRDGEFEQTAPYGPGHATPELAHQEGLLIDSNAVANPFKEGELISKIYENRVQALWVQQ